MTFLKLKKIQLWSTFIICMSLFYKGYAISAYPFPITYTQPNGDTLTLIMYGDEKVKYAKTIDDYTLLYDKTGSLNYAQINRYGDLEPSVLQAKSISKRSFTDLLFLQNISKNLTFSQSQVEAFQNIKSLVKDKMKTKGFPTTGNRRLLCILMSFKDKAFTKTQEDFYNLFNQISYNIDGATGSVKDYFLECSYNQLNLEIDVVGPYTSNYNMSYYGGNDEFDGGDQAPQKLAAEAFQKANNDVNYANYDNDNNGYVDGVYIIFAGYGEESGGGSDCIWSHASSVYPKLQLDNKYVYGYSCSPELRRNTGSDITYIGVICHEFGHTLGAMDFYDTDYKTNGQYQGTGYWDLQASGSWNNGGRTPAHPNPRTKIETYNWATATVLTSPKIITMFPSLDSSNAFYRINTSTSDEYFLIENRQQKKFDSNIPGHGLMIYHCLSDIEDYEYNNTINAGYPQYFYPVAANAPSALPDTTSNSYGTINTTSCPWPGKNTKTNFTDITIPAMKSYTHANTNKPITNIIEDTTTGIITFHFMDSIIIPPTVTTLAASDIDSTYATLNGSVTIGSEVLIAQGFEWKINTDTAYTRNSCSGNTPISLKLNNLTKNTTYLYRVFAKTASGYTYGSTLSFKTVIATETIIYPTSFESCTSLDSGKIYKYNNQRGYVCGSNSYPTSYYAQKYNLTNATKIIGIQTLLKRISGSKTDTLTLNLWSENNSGKPLKPLASYTYTTEEISEDWDLKTFYFDTTIIDSNFFLSIQVPEMNDSNSNIIIASSKLECSSEKKSYLYYDTYSSWVSFSDFIGKDLDLFIFPIIMSSAIIPTTVKIDTVTNITVNSISVNGSYVQGTGTIISKGFEYKESTATTFTQVTISTEAFNATFSNLTPMTKYIVRAFVCTTNDTIYGDTLSLTTLAPTMQEIVKPYSCFSCYDMDTVYSYVYPYNMGYITGSNLYSGNKYAQKYNFNSSTKIIGMAVFMKKVYQGVDENLTADLYTTKNNGASYSTTTSKTYSTKDISTSDFQWIYFYFNTPITSTDFLLSITVPEMTDSSSDIIIGSTEKNCGSSESSYIYGNYGGNGKEWSSFIDVVGYDLDFLIFPIVNSIITPTVSTNAVANITDNSVRLSGNGSGGTYPIISKGFEWRKQSTTSWESNTTPAYIYNLKNLEAGTEYEARCFVATVLGKYYGNIISFKTSSLNTNILETETEKSLTIYPNPTLDKLEINHFQTEINHIYICDIYGRIVFRANVSDIKTNKTIISVASLAKGQYFLNIETSNTVITKKFIKQ